MVADNTIPDINGYLTKSTKMVTVYPYNNNDTDTNNYKTYQELHTESYGYGDAILETSTQGNGNTSWNADFSGFLNTNDTFFLRGAPCSDETSAGIFAFRSTNGYTYAYDGFRPALIVFQ